MTNPIKNNAALIWQHFIHVWLLGRSGCSLLLQLPKDLFGPPRHEINSVTRFGEISPLWQNLLSLCQYFECIFSNCLKFVNFECHVNGPILENNLAFWSHWTYKRTRTRWTRGRSSAWPSDLPKIRHRRRRRNSVEDVPARPGGTLRCSRSCRGPSPSSPEIPAQNFLYLELLS